MNRFNLTFSGEIQQGEKPDAVKLRFAKKFAIDDPDRLARFFSGQEIILRRNLDRKAAAECFQEMRQIGVVAALVKVSSDEAAAAVADADSEVSNKSAPQKSRSLRRSDDAADTRPEKIQEASPTPPKRRKKNKRGKNRETAAAAQARDAQREALEEQETSQLAAEREARERAEAERARAEEEKQQALAALREVEESAQRRIDEALARRKVEEEAALAAAREREEATRKAEEAARVARELEQAREEEARRRAEAEAARQQAEQEREAAAREAERREQARREAEAEAARRADQEAQARRQAEEIKQLAEKETQRAQELARLNAELEAERRAAAEKTAALEAALQQSTEIARQEAEQQKARAEKRLAREKERVAKEKARLAHAAATREARLAKEQRDAEARAAKREAALAEKARQAEERLKEIEAAERAAREDAKRAHEQAREQLLLEEQARAMEDQTVDRAAAALSGKVGLGPARASTRTSLDVPQRTSNDPGRSTRKRQPGEPNFYALKPFRNTQAVRERAAQAGNAARHLASVGALALAALTALTGAFLNYTPAPAISNVSGVAVTPAGGPLLLAGEQLFLHDRAGKPKTEITLSDLGVERLSPPLAFEPEGTLLARGVLEGVGATQLLRCDLTTNTCTALPDLPANVAVVAHTSNPVNGELFLLDGNGGALLRVSNSGEIRARAELAQPEHPALRLNSGLLLLNSSDGPGISVLRYDDGAFGEQIDEILLVPPAAAAAQHSRVGDFLFSGGNWWVTLYNPDNGSAGLYRFDSQWNYLDQAALGHPSLPLALTNWGDKTLVNDGRGIALGRFNSSGGVEVPLTSAPLAALADSSRLRTQLLDSGWRAALLALGLVALLAFAGAYLQRLRHLVYRATNERGAEPVDDLLDNVEWINAAPERGKILRTRLMSYGGVAFALLLIAVGQRVGALQLAAILLFLMGPGIALALVARSSAGHIGVCGARLLLVEPAGTYHLGGGADLLYRGHLVFIDDVTLYTGSRLLPAFSEEDIAQRVEPLVESGVRIDARTALTRLLQSQHPLARALTIIAASTTGALALLAAGGIF